MSYTLSPMPRHPEQKRSFKEHEPLSYYLASTFKTRKDAEQPYQRVQEIVFSPTYDLELSAFHFEKKPHDPRMPPLARPWFVVVLGEKPPEPIEQRLLETLGSGEITALPLETVVTLAQSRHQPPGKASGVKGRANHAGSYH